MLIHLRYCFQLIFPDYFLSYFRGILVIIHGPVSNVHSDGQRNGSIKM
jgi:hypothetical protein